MARLPILEYPDPRLRRQAAPVTAFDAGLARLVDDLFETLYDTGGIGLSAPQTGHLLQVMVMDLSENRSAPQVYVNPQILSTGVPGLVEESCLSIPGVVGNVVRATQLRIRAFDSSGEPFLRELEGMHAVCAQHEMDHLEGILFIDRLSLLRRLQLRLAGALKGEARGVAAGASPAGA